MSNQTAPQQGQNQQVVKKFDDKAITDDVLKRLQEKQELGEIVLPKNYAPGNALKAALLILKETKNKDSQYALDYCTRESIGYALLDMAIQGLNPMKKQCYFIMHGRTLTMMRSYMGTIRVAKRVAGVKEVAAATVYEKDVFKYTKDVLKGKTFVTAHEQEFDNIDESKVKGAYAVIIMQDGTVEHEVMTIQQIRNSWEQGIMGGKGKVHNKFTSAMCEKTVIAKALKLKINSSDDGDLFDDEDKSIDVAAEDVHAEIVENANKGEIGFNQDDLADPESKTEKKETDQESDPVKESETVSEEPDWN